MKLWKLLSGMKELCSNKMFDEMLLVSNEAFSIGIGIKQIAGSSFTGGSLHWIVSDMDQQLEMFSLPSYWQ
jgi:hypothetical protein